MHRLRRIGVLGAIAGVFGVLAAASPAAASSPYFVTPEYGMTCTTDVTGGAGGYQGSATCFTPDIAKWRVRVDCSFGLTYDSIAVYTTAVDGWRYLAPGNTCLFGVNSVRVIEMS
jgi:hypothetical protein